MPRAHACLNVPNELETWKFSVPVNVPRVCQGPGAGCCLPIRLSPSMGKFSKIWGKRMGKASGENVPVPVLLWSKCGALRETQSNRTGVLGLHLELLPPRHPHPLRTAATATRTISKQCSFNFDKGITDSNAQLTHALGRGFTSLHFTSRVAHVGYLGLVHKEVRAVEHVRPPPSRSTPGA